MSDCDKTSIMLEDVSAYDAIDECIMIIDCESYQLLYANRFLRNTIHIDSDTYGTCYTLTQGRDTPCPYCNHEEINKNGIQNWYHFNEKLGKHFLLKDRIVCYKNHAAKLEIAIDVSELEEKKSELALALNAEKHLSQYVSMLYTSTNIQKSLESVLEHLGKDLNADRTYFFEILDGVASNTHEWCRDGVAPQKQKLQKMDVKYYAGRWVSAFKRRECICVMDIESIREEAPVEYEVMLKQNIHSYIEAPIENNGILIGFIGVDNPPVNMIKNCRALLFSLACFISSSIAISDHKKMLEELSYSDVMTGVCNRNAFIRDINTSRKRTRMTSVGIAYFDLNNLKTINDTRGHAAGDATIVELAHTLCSFFKKENIYRIGGDEFIIIVFGIPEEMFDMRILSLMKHIESQTELSVAEGHTWTDTSDSLKQNITKVDLAMYKHKRGNSREKDLA